MLISPVEIRGGHCIASSNPDLSSEVFPSIEKRCYCLQLNADRIIQLKKQERHAFQLIVRERPPACGPSLEPPYRLISRAQPLFDLFTDFWHVLPTQLPENTSLCTSETHVKDWHSDCASLCHRQPRQASKHSRKRSGRKICNRCLKDLEVPLQTLWPKEFAAAFFQ